MRGLQRNLIARDDRRLTEELMPATKFATAGFIARLLPVSASFLTCGRAACCRAPEASCRAARLRLPARTWTVPPACAPGCNWLHVSRASLGRAFPAGKTNWRQRRIYRHRTTAG